MPSQGAPNLVQAESFKPGGIYSSTKISPDGKKWYYARGLGFQGLMLSWRLKMAWRVFTGRYDALEWGGGQ
jgi:hypothetical protein